MAMKIRPWFEVAPMGPSAYRKPERTIWRLALVIAPICCQYVVRFDPSCLDGRRPKPAI